MQVEFSNELKKQIDNEIINTKSLIEALEAKVKGLQCLLDNRAPEGHPEANKRPYRKVVKGGPVLDITIAQERAARKKEYMARWRSKKAVEGNGHVKKERVYKDMSPEAVAKREYQRKWAAARRAGGIKAGGKIAKPIPAVNRFTLEREFDLGDKDISLIISYMISWKATGRLSGSENIALDAIQGISKTNLSDVQKSNLREAFYCARGRIMERARSTSDA